MITLALVGIAINAMAVGSWLTLLYINRWRFAEGAISWIGFVLNTVALLGFILILIITTTKNGVQL